jgi:hypothetical protein
MSNGYGYYYDWLDMRWAEKTTPVAAISWPHYHRLVEELVEEMRRGDSESRLYAGLLARKLIAGRLDLMKKYGREVAELSGNRSPRNNSGRRARLPAAFSREVS